MATRYTYLNGKRMTQAAYDRLKLTQLSDIHRGPSAPIKTTYLGGKPTQNWSYLSPAEYKKFTQAQKAAAAKTAAPAATPSAAGIGQAGAVPAAGTAPGSSATGAPPDYQAYLNVDPILAATRQNIQGQDILGQSTLVGGAQQLYGRLGEMPVNLPPALAALLGPEQRAALEGAISQGNQAGTTALARLQHEYGQGQAGIGAAYAARGGRSGGYGVHQNELLHDYTLGQYDARLGASDALQQLQNTYLSGQQERAGQQVTALTDAQERAGKLIGSGYGLPSVNPYMPPKTAAPTTATAPAAPKPPALPKPAAPFTTSRLGQTAARSL